MVLPEAETPSHSLFFFQAEDGIRDADVTGVQTCALPISDRALVRAEQPALQQRGNAVGARHDDMGRIAAGRNARLLMDEAGAGESAVALPVIGVDDRAGLDRSADEVGEHTSGAVRDAGKPDPATRPARTRLDRDRDDRPVDK